MRLFRLYVNLMYISLIVSFSSILKFILKNIDAYLGFFDPSCSFICGDQGAPIALVVLQIENFVEFTWIGDIYKNVRSPMIFLLSRFIFLCLVLGFFLLCLSVFFSGNHFFTFISFLNFYGCIDFLLTMFQIFRS